MIGFKYDSEVIVNAG